jgi:hypothetical protein
MCFFWGSSHSGSYPWAGKCEASTQVCPHLPRQLFGTVDPDPEQPGGESSLCYGSKSSKPTAWQYCHTEINIGRSHEVLGSSINNHENIQWNKSNEHMTWILWIMYPHVCIESWIRAWSVVAAVDISGFHVGKATKCPMCRRPALARRQDKALGWKWGYSL